MTHQGETSIHLADRITLRADLRHPTGEPVGLVVFVHGSGSGRHSPRNRHVAEVLQEAGMQTLLLDLLTVDEERIDAQTREYRFNIPLLADRVVEVIEWVRTEPDIGNQAIGLFGASTGAAAALIAAAERPFDVAAVVSRAGRPDLADDALPRVQASTLLIVGGNDPMVEELNRQAQSCMNVETRLEIVPGATHLFEEPGALDIVAALAARWFLEHLTR
ncbi:MAG: dienelactone hydrolase family protein [Actinomycetia bacterium]|nr:dienelactone hydrolase family protein [Actinomycetes bacterium]